MKLAKILNSFTHLFTFVPKTERVNKNTLPLYKYFFRFPKVLTDITMKNPKFYSHAQTQHGDETVDLENIVLCKANLFLTTEDFIPIEEVKNNSINAKQCGNEIDSEKFESVNSGKSLENNSSINSESNQCVWFFDVVEDYFAEKEKGTIGRTQLQALLRQQGLSAYCGIVLKEIYLFECMVNYALGSDRISEKGIYILVVAATIFNYNLILRLLNSIFFIYWKLSNINK